MRINGNGNSINAYGRMGVGGNNGRSQTVGDFNTILKEQASKIADGDKKNAPAKIETPSKTPFETLWGANGILNRTHDDLTAKYGNYNAFSDDPELKAYARQLALENGIAPINEDGPGKINEQQEKFSYVLSQLLDKGLISRQDIIDSVNFPPKPL
jgi:hypothetical protein